MGIFDRITEKQYKRLLERIEELEEDLDNVRKMAKRAENKAYRMSTSSENDPETRKVDLIWGNKSGGNIS